MKIYKKNMHQTASFEPLRFVWTIISNASEQEKRKRNVTRTVHFTYVCSNTYKWSMIILFKFVVLRN